MKIFYLSSEDTSYISLFDKWYSLGHGCYDNSIPRRTSFRYLLNKPIVLFFISMYLSCENFTLIRAESKEALHDMDGESC